MYCLQCVMCVCHTGFEPTKKFQLPLKHIIFVLFVASNQTLLIYMVLAEHSSVTPVQQ